MVSLLARGIFLSCCATVLIFSQSDKKIQYFLVHFITFSVGAFYYFLFMKPEISREADAMIII